MIKNLHLYRSLTRSLATMALAIFMLTPGWGWGQTTIAIQDFENVPATPTWSYTANGGSINSTFNRYNGAQSYRLASNNVLTMSNFNITGYTSVVLSVAFASLGVDSNEDLFMDISYDAGNTWTGAGSIKLVDGLSNASIAINTTTPNTVSSNPWPTNISVTETQIRVRFRATAMDAGEYYFIDDVKLTGILAITPTKLAITSISPSQPTIGSGFNVTVQAQDESNNPGNVTANTTFNLSSNGNAGIIGGTISGQINAGSNAVTVVGVTLSASGTGVTLTATRTGGDNLSAGTSNPFSVLEPATYLAFSGVPATGVINTNLSSFTVEARRPDNSIDNTFIGNVTLSKSTGSGAISGTLVKACIAGQATFNDIKFDAADTYTINSASGSLTGATSNNIAISLAIPSPPNNLSFSSVTNNSFYTSFVAPSSTPTGYLVLRRSVSAVTGAPVGGIEYTSGQTNIGGGVNEVMYVGSNVWTSNPQSGLTDNTAYHYAVYSYNGSGIYTVYSSTALIGNQTTSVIPAPTATTANPIGSNGFTANWAAVAGASSYKIDIYTETAGANATDLFISEYVEGSSNNKAIEIFNGTGVTKNLADYTLVHFNNGASRTTGTRYALTFTNPTNLPSGATYVIANSSASAAILAVANFQTSLSLMTYNGDDALAIYRSSDVSGTTINTGAVEIDILGKIGEDPGSEWGSGLNSTADNTLQRKSTITGGVTSNPATFDPSIEYNGFATDIISGLGSHAFSGGTTQTFEVEDVTVNGTSYDATGLDPNTTYYYRVRAVGANSTSANSNVITVATSAAAPTSTIFGNTGTGTNNWNDGPWSNGLPGPTSEAIIDGNATITTAVEVTNLTIYATRKLTIASGGSLTVTGILTNNAGNSGLVIKSGGSLKSTSVDVPATVERYITQDKYHSFSPSISNAKSGMFSVNSIDVYLYGHNEENNAQIINSLPTGGYNEISSLTESLVPMLGYAVYSMGSYTFIEEGPLNSGPYSKSLTRTGTGSFAGFNYVGNPYPSFINWNHAAMAKSNLTGAIYVENGSNWATYTAPGPGVNDGSNIISPGQGFFVEVLSSETSGSLGMENDVRTHTSTPYLKSSPTNYVRLIAEGNGKSDETVVRFDSDATAQYDGQYDATKLSANDENIPQIYSITDRKLAYNALPETNVVQLGFNAGVSGTYSISINDIADLHFVTLEDTKTGIFAELAVNPYSFIYNKGENEQRFKLHFSSVGVDEKETTSANIYSYQQTVYVNLTDNTQGDIYIYNLAGQLVTARESASGNVQIGLNATGVYMVKVITEKETLTQKVVIR